MLGAEALVATLIAHEVDVAFCVPGESYLSVIEALRVERTRLRLIVNRHESGATFAAEAYAKLSRRHGVAFVTRGPGASNAAIGIHTAAQDSTPLVLFIGQVPTAQRGREAFQEIDYHAMYGTIAKSVIEPERADQVAACTARALDLCMADRPGPVVVVLPEDDTMGEAGEPPILGPAERLAAAPETGAVARAVELIDAAQRPVLIAGERVGVEGAHAALGDFVRRSGAGVVAAFRRQDAYPTNDAAYLGHFGLGRAPFQRDFWAECDLVIAAGTRLDAVTAEILHCSATTRR